MEILLTSRSVWAKEVDILLLQSLKAMRPLNLLITRLQGLAPEAAVQICDKIMLPMLATGRRFEGIRERIN